MPRAGKWGLGTGAERRWKRIYGLVASFLCLIISMTIDFYPILLTYSVSSTNSLFPPRLGSTCGSVNEKTGMSKQLSPSLN